MPVSVPSVNTAPFITLLHFRTFCQLYRILQRRCDETNALVDATTSIDITHSPAIFTTSRSNFYDLVTHDIHELLDLQLRQRFRHQVGWIYVRTDLLLDEPA